MSNGVAGIEMGRVLQTVGGILLTICTALSSYTITQVIENANRITAIEANRYSSQDAKDDQQRTSEAVKAIWKEIAAIREDLAGRPRVRTDDLQDIKTRLALIEQALREIKEK